MRAPRKRVRNPDASRKALVDAAAALFNEVGFHGTDSNRIARRAGYAPGTFYVHFADKTEIFLAVYEHWVQTEWDGLERALQAGGPAARLRATLAKETLEHHRRWRGFRASLRALTATDERVHRVRVEQRGRQVAALAKLTAGRGGKRPAPTRAALWAILLEFEVLCDGVSEGDAKALGIPEAEVLARLAERLTELVD